MAQDDRLILKLIDYFARGNKTYSDKLFTLRPNFALINKIKAQYFEPKLVECSVGANQEQLQRRLTLHPELAAKKHTFTDWSGRTYHCSVFEYAFWTKDVKYMCPMILDCLPKNADGEAIRIELKNQAQAILTNGLSYQLNGTQYQEKCFSLEPLKLALKIYIDSFDGWDWSQREKHWCTKVGTKQALLPAYIRQHYCDPYEAFYSKPTFTKKQLTRSLKFISWESNRIELLWESGLVGLGSEFAITGGRRAWRSVGERAVGGARCAAPGALPP